MKQAWVVLQTKDIKNAIAGSVVDAASVEAAMQGDLNFADLALMASIDRILAAVTSSGRVPLSLSTGAIKMNSAIRVKAVPPQASWHTLVLAADILASRIPTMNDFIKSESWIATVNIAEEWIKQEAKDGLGISDPLDPDTTAIPNSVAVLDVQDVDMSTDGPPATITAPAATTPTWAILEGHGPPPQFPGYTTVIYTDVDTGIEYKYFGGEWHPPIP